MADSSPDLISRYTVMFETRIASQTSPTVRSWSSSPSPGWGAPGSFVALRLDRALREVLVHVRLPDPEVLAHSDRRELAGLDEPVHRHVRNAHRRRHLAHGEEPVAHEGPPLAHRPALPCLPATFATAVTFVTSPTSSSCAPLDYFCHSACGGPRNLTSVTSPVNNHASALSAR